MVTQPLRRLRDAILPKPAQRYLLALLVSLDFLLNAFLGGVAGETLSSRAGKAARRGARWGCVLCRLLDRIDTNHCERVMQADRGAPIPPRRSL